MHARSSSSSMEWNVMDIVRERGNAGSGSAGSSVAAGRFSRLLLRAAERITFLQKEQMLCACRAVCDWTGGWLLEGCEGLGHCSQRPGR